jgi:hypothetical protein
MHSSQLAMDPFRQLHRVHWGPACLEKDELVLVIAACHAEENRADWLMVLGSRSSCYGWIFPGNLRKVEWGW